METNLICRVCEKHIKRNEGFVPKIIDGFLICEHSPTCENPLPPQKTMKYNPGRRPFVLKYFTQEI